ncbi:MAG: methyltransferase type 11 [Frondihabitans sp.]|nr:methyltransferase type 11 [Frondihabitans sp.]
MSKTDEVDVQQAEQEAQEAADLVAALEKRYVRGDDTVTPEVLSAQEGLSRFARLGVERARRKVEKAQAEARLASANSLRAEVDGYALGIGGRLVELLRAVEAAEAAVTEAVSEHNGKVGSWRKQMAELNIPLDLGAPVPPAEDGQLALGHGGEVHAGRRVLKLVDGGQLLENVRRPQQPEDREKFYAGVGETDAELPEPDEKFYYRKGERILPYSKKLSDAEVRAWGLTPISQAEAWGQE